MATYVNRHKKKKRILQVIVVTMLVSGIVMSGLLTSLIVLKVKVHQNNQVVEALSKDITTLDDQVSKVQKQEEEYKSEQAKLEQELSQYQDVVVPESMKK